MISSYLGLARKANLIIAGSEKVVNGLQNKKAFLVLISAQASQNTQTKFINKGHFYNVPVIVLTKEVIAKVYKEKIPMVLALTDYGLSQKILAIKGDEING